MKKIALPFAALAALAEDKRAIRQIKAMNEEELRALQVRCQNAASQADMKLIIASLSDGTDCCEGR